MGARNIHIAEQVPASRKLGLDAALELVADADELIVAKGRKVEQIPLGKTDPKTAAAAMLGPTGNLRAPTLKVGRTLIVGFDEDSYERILG
ncbi:MAG: hypothetical protein JJT88_08010 [Gammaproteobacteria bacterium]|nr:hypothetical protein [Gammaproteobacteria bacterium]